MIRFQGVDLFAGAGGVTTGIERAKYKGKSIADVIACINHDAVAIESHAANHSKVVHFTEDIKNFDVSKFPKFSDSPDIITYLWASLECTNFSNAKGGLPRDADSRTLANHLFRYIEHLKPDYILIENVKEFMSWGDLDENGKPINKEKGKSYLKWVKKVKSYGYDYEPKMLNAANYGAYTSRNRLFIIFARYNMPIVWPAPTHSKIGENGFKKWKAVKEVLDFSDKGQSIFGRKKDLSERTYRRIYAGMVKYIAGGEESFITKWMGNNQTTGINQGKSINDPCSVITTQNRLGLVQLEFLVNYHGNSETNNIDDPCPTIATHDGYALIQPQYFLDLQYSQGKQSSSIEEPSGSILTVPKQKLISVDKVEVKSEHFMDEQYGCSRGRSINEPAGSLTTNPKQSVVEIERAWLMNTNYNNTGTSIDQPAPPILASRRHSYLMNPQYFSKGSSIENPCFTLIARMDKKPPYLITTEEGGVAIEVYEHDSFYIKKIKEFMALYGIVDVKMRMLRIPELLRIQGFGDDYILVGTQAQRKKFIGNAVVPVIPKRLIESLYLENLQLRDNLMMKKAI